MKNSSNNDLLFLVPIVAIFTVAVTVAAALYYKDKSDQPDVVAVSNTSTYSNPTASTNAAKNISETANYRSYFMSEPFAENLPFEFTPAAWMQMMNNMMNNMQMTQMMHQMAAMPAQMMAPTMWVNPHAMLPNGAANSSQQPMDPKEYKKWYEQQLESMKLDKK